MEKKNYFVYYATEENAFETEKYGTFTESKALDIAKKILDEYDDEALDDLEFLRKNMNDGCGVDFEDNNLAVLEYDKAIAKITVSSVEVNGYGRRQFVVSGSKGTTSILPMENPSRMTYADLEINPESYKDLKVDMDVEDLPPSCRYDDMVKDFYSYCMGEKENPFTYAHDYLVQELLYVEKNLHY